MRRAALSLLLFLLSPAAFAAPRVALVIGNAHYAAFGTLANPVRDAQAIGQMLKGAGFDVVATETDADVRRFRRALADFEFASQGADIALVYFSGHGIEIDGRNYLVPVDAELKRDVDVQDEAVSLDRVLEAVNGARRLKFVILDACRSNPFQQMKLSGTTRAISRGLAPIEPGGGKTLVAYAAAAGTVAQDGAADHSPFTAALLKDMTIPNLDVRLALGRVHDDVLASTDNGQEPFTYGSLGGAEMPLFVQPGAQQPSAPPAAPVLGVRPSGSPPDPGSQAAPTATGPSPGDGRPAHKSAVAKLEAPVTGARNKQLRSVGFPLGSQLRRLTAPDPAYAGVATEEPPAHTLPQGQKMLINDGSCGAGSIKEITGGTSTTPRGRRCVPRG